MCSISRKLKDALLKATFKETRVAFPSGKTKIGTREQMPTFWKKRNYGYSRETLEVNIIDFWQNGEKDGKDQESIQSSTTLDPGYHMGK